MENSGFKDTLSKNTCNMINYEVSPFILTLHSEISMENASFRQSLINAKQC